MLLTWFLFLWWASLWKVSQPLWCVSVKPLVSRVSVVLCMSERVIGLPVSGFKKLLSSLESRRQPVKMGKGGDARCYCAPCSIGVLINHHYQTAKKSLNVENLELAENQTNNSLHSFINAFSCEGFCAPRPYPIYRYCWPHRALACRPLTSALAYIRLSVTNVFACIINVYSLLNCPFRPSAGGSPPFQPGPAQGFFQWINWVGSRPQIVMDST